MQNANLIIEMKSMSNSSIIVTNIIANCSEDEISDIIFQLQTHLYDSDDDFNKLMSSDYDEFKSSLDDEDSSNDI